MAQLREERPDPFEGIPLEVIVRIVGFMPLPDILLMRLVSRFWEKVITTHERSIALHQLEEGRIPKVVLALFPPSNPPRPSLQYIAELWHRFDTASQLTRAVANLVESDACLPKNEELSASLNILDKGKVSGIFARRCRAAMLIAFHFLERLRNSRPGDEGLDVEDAVVRTTIHSLLQEYDDTLLLGLYHVCPIIMGLIRAVCDIDDEVRLPYGGIEPWGCVELWVGGLPAVVGPALDVASFLPAIRQSNGPCFEYLRATTRWAETEDEKYFFQMVPRRRRGLLGKRLLKEGPPMHPCPRIQRQDRDQFERQIRGTLGLGLWLRQSRAHLESRCLRRRMANISTQDRVSVKDGAVGPFLSSVAVQRALQWFGSDLAVRLDGLFCGSDFEEHPFRESIWKRVEQDGVWQLSDEGWERWLGHRFCELRLCPPGSVMVYHRQYARTAPPPETIMSKYDKDLLPDRPPCSLCSGEC